MNKTIHAFLLFILSVTLIHISCERDTDPPTVSILSYSDQSQVWNTVKISVEVADNEGVSKVVFYVNGVETETIEGPPWEVDWNTRDYPDGETEIGFVAHDINGNRSREASLVLVINNTLVKVSIDEDYFPVSPGYMTKIPIILMAGDSTILGSSLMEYGESQTFTRPADFNDSTFNIAHGRFTSWPGNPDYFDGYLMYFMDMNPGEMIFEKADLAGQDEITGYCYFKAGNIGSYEYHHVSYCGYYPYAAGNIFTDSAKVAINQDLPKAYVYLRQGNEGLYGFYDNLEPRKTYQVNREDLSNDMQLRTISLPSLPFEQITIQIFAYPNPGDYDPRLMTNIFQDDRETGDFSPFVFHYPSNEDMIRDFYYWSHVIIDHSKNYFHSKYGPVPGSISMINADIIDYTLVLPRSVEAEITGSADVQFCSLSFNGDLFIDIFGPTGKNLLIPSIPAAFFEEYNMPEISYENLTYSRFQLNEYSDQDYRAYAEAACHMNRSNSYSASGSEQLGIQFRKSF